MFFHVFAQTTHVVAAPHGFACVGIPVTRLYIPSFIEIRSGVSEPQGVEMVSAKGLKNVGFVENTDITLATFL